MRPGNLFVALWGKIGNNEVAPLVEEKKPVAVLHNERVSPADRFPCGCSLERFPNSLAGLGSQTAQLPIAAYTVDVAVFQKWSAQNGIEMSGVFLVDLFALPGNR